MASILVVDDDENVRSVLRAILEKDGHIVSVADDGDRGAYVAAQKPFDLIIMDVVMKRQSGIEALREIRATRPNQKAILASGIASVESPDLQRLAAGLGVKTMLAKPFRPDDLLEAVRMELGLS